MKKNIATWVYLDSNVEKSKYPNTGGDSTSPEFQAIYWRCIVVFFETSLRFHKDFNHILFTNTTNIPTVDGLDLSLYFKDNNIEVITLENKYPLPADYFPLFRNQFFEFSIIDYLSKSMSDNDGLLLLDSDCIFTQSLEKSFSSLQKKELAMTYVVDYKEEYVMHGVSGKDMRTISNDLGLSLTKNLMYSGGELLFAKGEFYKLVAEDFPSLYNNMITRHNEGKIKFNEEAHVLSYYYYKHNVAIGSMDHIIKRLWTNRNYYRNVKALDKNLSIWHLPNEKKVGIHNLFKSLIKDRNYLKKLNSKEYLETLYAVCLLPENHKRDWYKAIKNITRKFLQKINIIGK